MTFGPLEIVTLVIAVVGLVISVLALAWHIVSLEAHREHRQGEGLSRAWRRRLLASTTGDGGDERGPDGGSSYRLGLPPTRRPNLVAGRGPSGKLGWSPSSDNA
jgi:hypothetical protein